MIFIQRRSLVGHIHVSYSGTPAILGSFVVFLSPRWMRGQYNYTVTASFYVLPNCLFTNHLIIRRRKI